jgi:hypothetical protein
LAVFDCATDALVETIATNIGPWSYASSDPKRDLAYVTSARPPANGPVEIHVVDVKARKALRAIPLSDVPSAAPLIWPTTDELVFYGGRDGVVEIVSPTTGRAEAPLARGIPLGRAVVASLGNREGPALRPPSERPPAPPAAARFQRFPNAAAPAAPATPSLPPAQPVPIIVAGAVPDEPQSRGELTDEYGPSAPIVSDLSPAERARLEPTRITVALAATPARTAFDALTRESGIPFVPYSDDVFRSGEHPVTFEGKEVPLWAAVAEVARQTDSLVQFHPGPLASVGRGSTNAWRDGRVAASGPFLLEAWAPTAQPWYEDKRRGGKARNVELHIAARPEPNARYVGNARMTTVVDVADENGRPFDFPARPGGKPYNAGTGAWIKFTQRDPNAKRIGRVSGVMHALLAVAELRATIDDCLRADPGPLKLGGLSVARAALTREPITGRGFHHVYTLRLTLERGTMDDQSWRHAGNLLRVLRVDCADASGRPLLTEPGPAEEKTGLTVRAIRILPVRPLGRDAATPASLTFSLPARLAEVDVPFVFRDLPLPP